MRTLRVVTLIQARTGSSRLPSKVLMPLAGASALERMIERVKAAKLSGQVVVATTTESSDDPIVEICENADIPCFRGHPLDLLDRHYRAALQFNAQAVVKIPSDCPLIDPAIIDLVIGRFLASDCDFASNLHPATYPDGNDVEIMTFQTLERTWKEATRPLEREHTTPYIWENPGKFKIENVRWESGLDYSMSHRFTLDYQEDYEMIRAVYDELYPKQKLFTLSQILALLERKPEIAAMNKKLLGVNWYRNHLDELKTIQAEQTRSLPNEENRC